MKNLTEGNIFKNFISFAIPLILAGLLSQAFNTMDTIVVGKILGEHGLAAVGSTSTFIQVISAIIWGLGTGVSIYIAALFGSGNIERTVNAIKVNLIALTVVAVLISVIVIVFYRNFFDMLSIDEEIYSDAFTYFSIYAAGFFILSFNWCSVFVFNALGNSGFPVIVSLVSCFLNLVINVLFIAVFKMGVAGAAWATVLVAFCTAICYIMKFSSDFKKQGLSKQPVRLIPGDMIKAWRMGVPCMLQQLVMYLSSVGVQPLINGIGSAAIAAYAVCMQIYNLNSTIFQNSSKCLANFCAQSIGAKKIELVKKGMKTGIIQVLMFTLPMMLICYIFSEEIAGFFYGEPSGKSFMYVVEYMKLCVPFFAFQIFNNLFHNFYRGVMAANVAAITTFFYSVIRLAASYVLVPRYQMTGVFAALIIAWVSETVLAFIIYKSGKWKTQDYKLLENS